MKVCLIHNLWKPYARGGGERAIENIALALRERGDEVIIITTKPWGASVPDEAGIYRLASGYHFLDRWPIVVRLLWHFFNVFNPLTYFQVRSILNRERPDIVWTHNLTGFGFLVLKLTGRYRHIHTVHDIQLLHPSGLIFYGHENITKSLPARMYQALLRCIIPKKTSVIFPSQWIERIHLEHNFFTTNKRLVINNPLNEVIALNTALTHESKDSDIPTKFLFVGQIEIHKGILLLLEAFCSFEGIKELTIIGEGSLLADLRTHYAAQPITFLGWQTKEQIREQMEHSDCLVVPSLCYENQPTVILEAQAVGLQVIASNIGGIPELVPAENLFIPNTHSVSEKMRQVCDLSFLHKSSHPQIASVTEYITTIITWFSAGNERP